MIRLYLFKEVTLRLPQKRIQVLHKNIMRIESESDSRGRINLVFTSDSHVRKLNGSYRNKDKTTDVLSFNIDKPIDKDAVIGEIYVSVPTAKKQAKEYGSNVNDELIRLTCHGLLHLLGFDHIKISDRKKMESRENYFLKIDGSSPT